MFLLMKNLGNILWLSLLFLGATFCTSASPTPAQHFEATDYTPEQVTPDQQIFIPSVTREAGLSISVLADNRGHYFNGHIPQYEKFEVSFEIENTVAKNFQFPYDPNPPTGIDLDDPSYQGINVDARFTPDNWQTVYQQPAFYYQHYEKLVRPDETGQNRDWIAPTGQFAWQVRFAPHQPGDWQYQIVAQDATGQTTSEINSFRVVESNHPGFIRVSETDRRYFEFDEGQLFFPLGFQFGSHFGDPTLRDEARMRIFSQNGINMVRVWTSELFGSAWTEWIGGRNIYDGYLPRPGIVPFYDEKQNRTFLTQHLDYETGGDTGWFDACRFRFWDDPEPVKPNTTYLFRIEYWGTNISGPRRTAEDEFGLVAKIGNDWDSNCFEPGTNEVVTNYGRDTSDWGTISGIWYSGENHFLPTIYFGLENVTEGNAYIKSVSLREDLGNGRYGPEIIAEPSLAYESYFPDREAMHLDMLVERAEKYGLFLKLVIHDKNDKVFFKINDDGSYVYDGPDNEDGFYGIGRDLNKTRWLQRAWWRYLQARWGYSAAIHSWELTNEGDPWNEHHYALADELGKFMQCTVFGISVASNDGASCKYDHPNGHLVTTSFWHSLPTEGFWANPGYPNLDYVDIHAYVSTGWLSNPAYENDTALFHLDYSADARRNLDYFANMNGIPTKPIIRGETGIDFDGSPGENIDLAGDHNGVWLHNFIWSGLDPGGMMELYWFWEQITIQPGPDGQPGLYEIYGYFRNFLGDIPLNNGHYQDAVPQLTASNLRSVGQKDLVNGRAHLWVQNKNHTWRRVVDHTSSLTGLTGTVTLTGFQPGAAYQVEWHAFTTEGRPTIWSTTVTADRSGQLILRLPTDPLYTDVGVKIRP